jgi:transglutaminase-like putative cysteine protease
MIAFSSAASPFPRTSLAPRVKSDAVLYEVVHLTQYSYDNEIQRSEHQLRLTPIHDLQQEIQAFALNIDPCASMRPYQDSYGNEVVQVCIQAPYRTLRIESHSLVSVSPPRPLDDVEWTDPIDWPKGEWERLHHLMIPDDLPTHQLRILRDYARHFLDASQGRIIPTIDAINDAIFKGYAYKPGSTEIGTSVFDVFVNKQGVCQDFTNLMLCLLRLLNIPALYRTGYIYTGKEQNAHINPDASHAWVEVYLPLVGWCGWDPTNGGRAGIDHIRLASGRSSYDATPTSGTIYSPFQSETLTVHVKVKRRGALDHEFRKLPDGRLL